MGQERNLTTTQHWELHQGLWNTIGCDMQVYKQDSDRIIYIDKKRKRQYTYSTLGFIKEKRL